MSSEREETADRSTGETDQYNPSLSQKTGVHRTPVTAGGSDSGGSVPIGVSPNFGTVIYSISKRDKHIAARQILPLFVVGWIRSVAPENDRSKPQQDKTDRTDGETR